jgi:hypothetical protein
MKTIAKIQNAIIGVQELKGENYFNVLLWDGKNYNSVAELVPSFERALIEALKCQNLIEYIK